nr:hypothetical protein [Belnapia arida]
MGEGSGACRVTPWIVENAETGSVRGVTEGARSNADDVEVGQPDVAQHAFIQLSEFGCTARYLLVALPSGPATPE